MVNGDIRKLGTLYIDDTKQLNPTMPWESGNTPEGAPGAGNIPKYTSGNIEIRDTDVDDEYKINWIEVNDGDKKLLIADRNILCKVSWDTLNAQGLISGKDVTIDGQKYTLRVLTGGSDNRIEYISISGGSPTDNEWDRIITNESKFSGLPVPNATDLDNTPNEADRLGVHNSKWNWYYCGSWCQEEYANGDIYSSLRGIRSVLSCTFFAKPYKHEYIGWRPVLETTIPKKYLYKDEDGYKYYTDTWNLIGEEITRDDFELYGDDEPIADINILNQLIGKSKMVVGANKSENQSLPIKVVANPKDKIVVPNSNISIENIKNVKSFIIDGNSKVLFSLDGGLTYKTIVDSNFEDVDLGKEVYDIAIDKNLLKNLPMTILSEIANSNAVRIAYVLRDNDFVNKTSVISNTINSVNQMSPEITFDLGYTTENKANVYIYRDGDYIINSFAVISNGESSDV